MQAHAYFMTDRKEEAKRIMRLCSREMVKSSAAIGWKPFDRPSPLVAHFVSHRYFRPARIPGGLTSAHFADWKRPSDRLEWLTLNKDTTPPTRPTNGVVVAPWGASEQGPFAQSPRHNGHFGLGRLQRQSGDLPHPWLAQMNSRTWQGPETLGPGLRTPRQRRVARPKGMCSNLTILLPYCLD